MWKVRKYLLNWYCSTSNKILTLTYDSKTERDEAVGLMGPVSVVNVEIDYKINSKGELIVTDEHSGIYQLGAKYENNRKLQIVKTSSTIEEKQQ